MSAHPFDRMVPVPWLPDYEFLAAERDGYARCVARETLAGRADSAGLLLVGFAALDDVCEYAREHYATAKRTRDAGVAA